jgi:hypothetical protein
MKTFRLEFSHPSPTLSVYATANLIGKNYTGKIEGDVTMKVLWQLDALRYEVRVTGILLFGIPLFFAFGIATLADIAGKRNKQIAQ